MLTFKKICTPPLKSTASSLSDDKGYYWSVCWLSTPYLVYFISDMTDLIPKDLTYKLEKAHCLSNREALFQKLFMSQLKSEYLEQHFGFLKDLTVRSAIIR